MNSIKFIKLICLTLVLLSSHLVNAQIPKELALVPYPKEVELGSGSFILQDKVQLFAKNDSQRGSAMLFNSYINKRFGIRTYISAQAQDYTKIKVSHDSDMEEEAYHLSVKNNQIEIKGGDAGIFYAFQTLIQLIEPKGNELHIPVVEIKDKPEFGYRGLMIDVSRHFRTLEEMKQVVDLMAHFKLNKLHWHLTDDQGWRLEIKKYPKLTQVAAWRDSTIIGQYGNYKPFIYDGIKHGGFYTQDEARELVRYAAERKITVIPEIELPGHSSAVLAAYPEFGSFDVVNGVPIKGLIEAKRENGNSLNNEISTFVPGYWGIHYNIFGPKEETFKFLEDVLTEVMEIFPSEYIHIGGDEVPKDHWKTSEIAQSVIKKNKLKDEHELQSYFIKRIEKFLNKNGRNLIGWDEILEGGLAPNATVMSWRGEAGGIAAAKMGHDVIMTPNSHMYIDHGQGKQADEPLFICCYLPLEKVYSYHPRPMDLTQDQQKHILGVQANMWTEYVPSFEKMQYMIFPRLLALSEVAWMPQEEKDFSNFAKVRMPKQLAELDQQKINFRIPEALVEVTLKDGKKEVKLHSSVAGSKIYYTFDGHKADRTAHLYRGPFFMPVNGEGQEPLKLRYIIVTPSNRESGMYTVDVE
ncbi:N-acetyl-beta-hexosaminidase [Belliella baltica DSM 15883]|uniref:beta-N-acetylhexosaminidase n=1 Tax=Belliella baltica (strain DSM 15883 / CIP 108006 / LMG 21964 / BA134) TaxID=866536 RepID=I3Z958_BELBD|nr:family 20 glycosylhydrolase [Belliella baltica]AFL85776.1 N-acetyl-beta-hexosaminidase [Belliella baltica DSM 15883]